MSRFANHKRMREAGALLAQQQEQERLANKASGSEVAEGDVAQPRAENTPGNGAGDSNKPKSIFAQYEESGK